MTVVCDIKVAILLRYHSVPSTGEYFETQSLLAGTYGNFNDFNVSSFTTKYDIWEICISDSGMKVPVISDFQRFFAMFNHVLTNKLIYAVVS